ncbi:MAG: amidohydrolase family protein [Clostridia bacterium]|nr:amidohydrolase family protein [Clostridia bacterium]
MYFDIHAHLYKYPYPRPCAPSMDARGYFEMFLNEQQLLERHDAMQIDRAVILPLVSAEVYVPQSVGEVIDICNASGGRLIPFCNLDPRVLYNTSDSPIGFLMEHYKKLGCRGLGEVLPSMDFSDPKLHNLMKCAEEVGFPFLFDLTALKGYQFGLYDDAGLPQLENALAKYPDLIFIGHGSAFWSEMGSLRREEDRYAYPAYPIDAEGSVPRLMRAYPNLWVDLSARSGYNALARDKAYAAQFLTEFKERILFGTDLCYMGEENHLPELLEKLRDEGLITQTVFEGIAFRNAERLLGMV